MKLLIPILFLALTISIGDVSTADAPIPDDANFNDDAVINLDTGAALISALFQLEPVQQKVQTVYNLIDLKIRLIKILTSLITRENFVLLRRVLDLTARTSNFVIDFLPDPDHQETGTFLERLFPVIKLNPENKDREENLEVTEDNSIRYKRMENEKESGHESAYRDDILQVAQLVYSKK